MGTDAVILALTVAATAGAAPMVFPGRDWQQATRVQVPAALPLGHAESGIDGRGCYGFGWWVNGVCPGGGRKWPGAPASTFAASGYSNNDVFVIPQWRMVVRLGLDERGLKIGDETYGPFLAMAGGALRGP